MSLTGIGLIFAAAVAAFQAGGQVANKKIVEGQDVVSAVFWIRAFAALVFIAVWLVLSWRGSATIFIHPPAALTSADVYDVPALVNQLKNPVNPAAQRIVGDLSETTREQLAHYQRGVDDAKLAKDLSKDFDSERIIKGGLLYNARDFDGVTLSAETVQVLGKKPQGEVRSYANRLLLEDLFPGTIAKSSDCALFGIKGLMVAPTIAISVYLLIEIILVVWSQYLNSLAIKVAPISLCIPFTACQPIFVLATAYVVLHELPTVIGLMGIGMIVIGGILMHRQLFAEGWMAPAKAIVQDKGSRYMILSVLIGAIFSPIEKELILMSDALTTVLFYGVGTAIAFWILGLALRTDFTQVMREVPGWAVLCGLADALSMMAQFAAIMYLPVVIVLCIKRAGIVLTVLAGWLIFRERDITNRLIASVAMIGGIAIFYLPLHLGQAITLTGVVILGLAVTLYLTRNTSRKPALVETSAGR